MRPSVAPPRPSVVPGGVRIRNKTEFSLQWVKRLAHICARPEGGHGSHVDVFIEAKGVGPGECRLIPEGSYEHPIYASDNFHRPILYVRIPETDSAEYPHPGVQSRQEALAFLLGVVFRHHSSRDRHAAEAWGLTCARRLREGDFDDKLKFGISAANEIALAKKPRPCEACAELARELRGPHNPGLLARIQAHFAEAEKILAGTPGLESPSAEMGTPLEKPVGESPGP